MNRKFNVRQFVSFFVVVIVLFFLADVVFDAIKGSLVWSEIFSTNNILLKLAAGIIGGGIFAFKEKATEQD